MKINVKKTKVMCISHRTRTKIKIFIDGQRAELKYLGNVGIVRMTYAAESLWERKYS